MKQSLPEFTDRVSLRHTDRLRVGWIMGGHAFMQTRTQLFEAHCDAATRRRHVNRSVGTTRGVWGFMTLRIRSDALFGNAAALVSSTRGRQRYRRYAEHNLPICASLKGGGLSEGYRKVRVEPP
jgi:hypothetical protein